MARSVRRIRPITHVSPAYLLHQSPPDIHDSPYPFGKIRSFAYWLIIVRQCRERMRHRVFQVLPDGMDNVVEGILRRGIDVQVHVVCCQPYDIDLSLLKWSVCNGFC